MTSPADRTPGRRALLASGLAALMPLPAPAAAPASGRRVLTVAAFPLMDKIVEAAAPQWNQLHPDVALKVLSRPYADHHTAMTTALSTAVYLPDVMALEQSYVGRFAQGSGLDDLRAAPFDIGTQRKHYAPFAYDQATARSGAVVAAPADIGPGTLLYRTDVLAKAGVAPEDLTRSWDSFVDAGLRIKKNTGAFLISNVQSVKNILMRSGAQPGATKATGIETRKTAAMARPRLVGRSPNETAFGRMVMTPPSNAYDRARTPARSRRRSTGWRSACSPRASRWRSTCAWWRWRSRSRTISSVWATMRSTSPSACGASRSSPRSSRSSPSR